MTRGVAILAGLALALAGAPAAHGATVDAADLSGSGVLRVRSNKPVTLTVPGKRPLVVRASIRSRVPVTLVHDGPVEIGPTVEISAPAVTLKGATLRIEGDVVAPGGRITALGRRVDLASATLDVSHPRGGGSIFVGHKRLTKYTTVDSDSVIDADASRGKGGHIELWSSARTSMRGSATASGRKGGFVETSSIGVIDTNYAHYDLSGRTLDDGGRLVFDPSDITVVAGNGLVNNSGPPTFTPTGTGSQIGVDLINAQLAGGTAVTLDTTSGFSDVGNISIDAAISSGSGAALTLDADNNITLNANVTVNSLSMTAAGVITQAGGTLTIAGTTTAASGAATSLNQAGNDFGTVSVTQATDATINDANSVALGASTVASNLTVIATGAVTQSGALTVPGTATIATSTVSNITLTNAANDFGSFGVNSSNEVHVTDTNALTLAAVNASGLFVVNTGGDLTQSTSVLAGPAVFGAGTNDITLDDAGNDFGGAVGVLGADDVTLRDAGALRLVGVDITGALTATAAAGQLEGDSVRVDGATTVAGTPVTLDDEFNDFGGPVTVTSSGGSTASLFDTNDLVLGSSTSGGRLTATADDDLTVPAAATIAATGILTLVADNQNPAGPGIGTGGITIGANAALSDAGDVRMYGSRRGDNLISGSATFNGSTYLPGPLFIDSARERWGVYWPAGTATAPFTFFYKDADTSTATATITAPADGARYERNQVVNAAYTCSDGGGGTGVTTCSGTVENGSPIDTATLGQKTFSVEAKNGAGRSSTTTVTYTVVDTTKPTISVRSPVANEHFTVGDVVAASYTCADETALATCAGTVANGAALDTGSPGTKTFGVEAVDSSGNRATAALTYVVDAAAPVGDCKLTTRGTAAADKLTGTVFGDGLFGLDGNDVITGLAGDDCLEGGAGNDRMKGGDGVDRMRGGTGNDSVDGGAGNDRFLRGEAGNDRVYGAGGDDDLSGGDGNDRLSGGAGADTLTGGAGKDRLTGGAGRNIYFGRSGNDTINAANEERERIDCGSGNDTVTADEDDRLTACEHVRRR